MNWFVIQHRHPIQQPSQTAHKRIGLIILLNLLLTQYQLVSIHKSLRGGKLDFHAFYPVFEDNGQG